MSRASSSISWSASPTKELLRLSWPVVVSMLSYSVMTLVDTLFVARLGPAALTGVGVGGAAWFLVFSFGMGLLRAVKVLVAQARGAGREDRERGSLGAGLVLALVVGLLGLFVALALAQALPGLTETAAAGDAARTYLSVRGLGGPALLVFVALREARYGQGDSRTPMRASLVGNGLNVALDALFVLGLDLGVFGAALATVIADTAGGVLLVLAQRAHGFGLSGVRRATLVEMARLGLPTGLQFMLETGSFAVLSFMLASISDVEMAAHQIALQLVHFAVLPAVAVGESVSVLCGQAVGARRLSLVLFVARRGLLVVLGYAALLSLLFFVAGEVLARPFTDDVTLGAAAARLLVVAALFLVFDGASVVARGALRGAGDVRAPALVGVVCAWMFTPPLTWLLGHRLGLGALGGWLGLSLEIVVAAGLFWWRLERRRWLRCARGAARAQLS